MTQLQRGRVGLKVKTRTQGTLLLIIGVILAISACGILAGLFFEGFADIFNLRGGEGILKRFSVGLVASLIASFFLLNGINCWRKT